MSDADESFDGIYSTAGRVITCECNYRSVTAKLYHAADAGRGNSPKLYLYKQLYKYICIMLGCSARKNQVGKNYSLKTEKECFSRGTM